MSEESDNHTLQKCPSCGKARTEWAFNTLYTDALREESYCGPKCIRKHRDPLHGKDAPNIDSEHLPQPARPTDRPRGILSKRDRDFLLGHTDTESQTQREREIRQDIRERVIHAMYDMYVLSVALEQRDRDLIQDNLEIEMEPLLEPILAFLGSDYEVREGSVIDSTQLQADIQGAIESALVQDGLAEDNGGSDDE